MPKSHSEKPVFDAGFTGAQALAKALQKARTRTAVICPTPFFPDIYGELNRLPDKDRCVYLCDPATESSAVRAAFRSAMDRCPSVFLCGEADSTPVRKAARQLGHLEIPGGLVLIETVAPDSSRQVMSETKGMGTVTDPTCPEEIYDFYLEAADLALKHRCLVSFRVAGSLWAKATRRAWTGSIIRDKDRNGKTGLRQARICPECRHRSAVDAVRDILAAKDIRITAMACHSPDLQALCVIGSPPPSVRGCEASGVWIETVGGELVVYVGDDAQGPGFNETLRALGVERIFYCESCCGKTLASAIHEAEAWQGNAAVLAYAPAAG